jgi:anti-anti-sigma regulatory factor
MLMIVLGGSLIGLALGLLTPTGGLPPLVLIYYPLLIGTTGVALWLLRRGLFGSAVTLATSGLVLMIGVALIAGGLHDSPVIPLAFAIPTVLAGLLIGRRGLGFAGGLSIALVLIAGLLELFAPDFVGFARNPNRTPLAIIASFVLVFAVLCLFLDRFGNSLRAALAGTQAREHELEYLRAALETTVAERTASLRRTVEELSASHETIRAIGAPILPVLPGVLVAPLIGALDSARIAALNGTLLDEVARSRASSVILDITGVPVIDTQVAQALLRLAGAIRLLGARVLLVGIRAEVAQTLVTLGIDLAEITTFPNLQEAVAGLQTERGAART